MKAGPRQSRGKTSRSSGEANAGSIEGAEACELLLAELQARRVRLQKLLRLVWLEAERLPLPPLRPRHRARCENAPFSHTA